MRRVVVSGRKVRRLQVGCVAVLAALSALAAPARADSLPVAITETSCGADPNGVFQRIVDPTSCVVATALGSLTLSPFVSLSVQVSTLGVFLNGVHGGGATAVVRYFFEVTGGNSGDVVPLLIATNLSTEARLRRAATRLPVSRRSPIVSAPRLWPSAPTNPAGPTTLRFPDF